jgi:hypothetical protein
VFAYVCILKLDQNGCPIEIWLGEDLPFVRVAPKMAGTRGVIWVNIEAT